MLSYSRQSVTTCLVFQESSPPLGMKAREEQLPGKCWRHDCMEVKGNEEGTEKIKYP